MIEWVKTRTDDDALAYGYRFHVSEQWKVGLTFSLVITNSIGQREVAKSGFRLRSRAKEFAEKWLKKHLKAQMKKSQSRMEGDDEKRNAIAKLADMEVQQEIDMDNAWMANATPEEIAEIMGEDVAMNNLCPNCGRTQQDCDCTEDDMDRWANEQLYADETPAGEPLGLADLLKNPEYSERSTMSDAEWFNWLSKHHGKPLSPRHG